MSRKDVVEGPGGKGESHWQLFKFACKPESVQAWRLGGMHATMGGGKSCQRTQWDFRGSSLFFLFLVVVSPELLDVLLF